MRWRRAASVAPRMAASSRPPKRRGDGERIVERSDMARERGIDHRALARQAVLVDAGAAAGPARAAATEQSRRNSGRRRGVADAHFAEADEIAVRRHGVVTGRDRGEKFPLGQRRLLGEIRGRLFRATAV